MYDDKQKAMGLDPAALRNMSRIFYARCYPINEHLLGEFSKLHEVSFNFFSSEDTFETASGWTDYGDEDWEHTGFQILTNPFRIIEVRFRHYVDPIFTDDGDRIEFLSERQIAPLDAFHLYGAELFRCIADIEDWNVIIASFG